MRTYRFQILNVFAESTFGGNPLAVIEDARGLSDDEQQTLTDQFGLSETTFIWPAEPGSKCAARVRIFSPGYEMTFAGHPTLGTAHVVRSLLACGDRFTLALNVGPINVTAEGDRWELESAKPNWSNVVESPKTLGLRPEQMTFGARWVSTGEQQLMVPLRDIDAVHDCKPLDPLPRNNRGNVGLYVFAKEPNANRFVTRFFWEQQGHLREDPGTGSAAANLGGWHLAHDHPLPFNATIEQGHALNRLNVISLKVDAGQNIFVGGRVQPLMRGEVTL